MYSNYAFLKNFVTQNAKKLSLKDTQISINQLHNKQSIIKN